MAVPARLGLLLLDDQEPPTAAAPAACHRGHGLGYGTVSGGRLDPVTCWVCGGTGIEPATLAA